jgi:hypothetical protein
VNFHSYEQFETAREAAIAHAADPWLPVELADCPPAPCVRILVTDSMRAADAAQQAERQLREIGFGVEWRQKLQLTDNNLRIRRQPKVKAGRVFEDRRIVIRTTRRSAAQQAARHCSVCQAPIHGTTRSGQCSAHRPRWIEPRVPCARVCGGDVACRSNPVCVDCRRAERLAARPPAPPKAPRTRKAPTPPAQRLVCATEGCTHLMRAGRGLNPDGTRNADTCKLCSSARWGRLHHADRQHSYRVNRARRSNRHCPDCGVLVNWASRTGRCRLHAPAVRFGCVPVATEAARTVTA